MTDGAFRDPAELEAELDAFAVRTYALLVDDATPGVPPALPGRECVGAYTFTLAAAGEGADGRPVKLLPLEPEPPACDAWVVATPSKAVYALLRHLAAAGRQESIVLTLARGPFAPMFSYVDFFKGETETVVTLHNVFERAYKIHFPIAVRWLLRGLDGTVAARGQLILPPSHTAVLDGRELPVGDGFCGYLELFADVRHLTGPVTPFLHLNCDYLSERSLAGVHQSGLKPWPAGSRFVRGFVPADPESRLAISLVNVANAQPVTCTATLRYTLDGERREATRTLPPLPHRHMTVVEADELFARELQAGATQADVVVTPDLPLHRPNNYLHPKGRRWSWTGVEHGAALPETPLPADRRRDYERLGLHPWVCAFPLLDGRFDVATNLVYFSDGACGLHDFLVEAYDEAGRKVLEREERLEVGAVVDLQDYLRRHGAEPREGLVTVAPAPGVAAVPAGFSFLGAFEHRANPYLSPVVIGGDWWNSPVEVERSSVWHHAAVPGAHTEQFAKATLGGGFDTLVTIGNPGVERDYGRTAHVDLDVYAWDGRMVRTTLEIPPGSARSVSVSEVAAELGLVSDRPQHALWVYCRDLSVTAYHLLHRTADHAITVDHFYFARFNPPEPQPPSAREALHLLAERAPEASLRTLRRLARGSAGAARRPARR